MRQEQEIFDELAALCVSPGYVHAIANLCFRDNFVGFGSELTAEDIAPLFSESRLIRTEISTLIGLLVRQPVDYTLPAPQVTQAYMDQTERLLHELHESMSFGLFKGVDPEKLAAREFNPFSHGDALREPIFYSGESAYSFQYRDLAQQKYAEDNDWLKDKKGFYIQNAGNVISAVGRLQNEKLMATLKSMKSLPPDEWTILPGLSLTAKRSRTARGSMLILLNVS